MISKDEGGATAAQKQLVMLQTAGVAQLKMLPKVLQKQLLVLEI